MLRKAFVLGFIPALVLLVSPALRAESVAELQAQVEKIRARLEKIETQHHQRIEKEELARMMKDILDDAGALPALPAWIQDLTFSGDFRLRAEYRNFQGRRGGGTSTANPVVGEQKNRNRIRMRLRFGFTKTWWDRQMEVGFRLASGETADPTETNQTMTGDFSKKSVWIDLMYAKYKPVWIEGLEVTGGKVLNPIRTRTPITWDVTVNPEGLYVDYTAPFFGDFKPYAQIGYWIVNENGQRHTTWDTTVRDTTLASYSAGVEWKFMDALEWFFGATYYDYQNVDSSDGGWLGRYGPDGQWASGSGGQAPVARNLLNNNLPSAEYGLLELTTKVGWKLAFLPAMFQKWSAWASFVHNCRDDYNVWKNPSLPALGGVGADRHFQDDPNACAAGIVVGENKKRNDLSLAYTYYYIEYGSVVPGFGDGTLGGPNNRGHLLQATYNLDDFLTLSGIVVLYQPIHTNDNPANTTANVVFPHSADLTSIFRLELLWKF